MSIRLISAAFAAATLLSSAASAAPPPVEAYGALPDIEGASLSPSGERIALAGRFNGQRRVVVFEGERVLQMVDISDDKLRGLSWAGDDNVLIGSSDTYYLKGARDYQIEIDQMGVLNLASRRLIFAFSRGSARNGVWGSYGYVEEGGKWYGYLGGLTMDGEYPRTGHADLYRVDLGSGDAQLIERGGRGDTRRFWLLDSTGRIVARTESNPDRGQWRLLIGGRTVIETSDMQVDYGLAGLGRTPGTLLYARSGKDRTEIFELAETAASGPGERLYEDAENLSLIHDPFTHLLIGTLRFTDRNVYEFFDPELQGRVERLERMFPGKYISIDTWTHDRNRMLVFTDGQGDSGTYWLVDFAANRASLVASTYENVPGESVGEIRVVRYPAQDGLEIEAILTLPPGREAKDLPVVVIPHGGPQARDFPGFDWMAQAFASRGYAVLQPNFRGSAGYGEAFIEAGKGEWGRKMQSDVSDGLRWLDAQGIGDASRACVFGASYGGYVAMAGVTVENGVYRCAVSYAGVSDLIEMVNWSADRSGDDTRRYWNDYMGDQDAKRQTSPARLADRADAPLLLIHGRDDTVVPLRQSEIMDRALRRAGKPVEMLVLDGEDHWLSTSETRSQMLRAAVDFIERHNPADPAPPAASASLAP